MTKVIPSAPLTAIQTPRTEESGFAFPTDPKDEVNEIMVNIACTSFFKQLNVSGIRFTDYVLQATVPEHETRTALSPLSIMPYFLVHQV
ncbi:hypothetical protein TNCV_3662881 [Trichonephila clavipes]|nr:hypothetical protein TNCV_3662881 [Trichonephila clavipes]